MVKSNKLKQDACSVVFTNLENWNICIYYLYFIFVEQHILLEERVALILSGIF